MKISVENTAIKNGVSKSIKENVSLIEKGSNILDYGAGKLRNTKYLIDLGFSVSVVDTPTQVSRMKEDDLSNVKDVFTTDCLISDKYEVIFSTFVLNVIPNYIERKELIEKMYSLLKEDGFLVLEVRRERGILSNKHIEPYNDGYLVGKGNTKTFQKPFNVEELLELIPTESTIVSKKIYSDSVAIIIKK